MKNFNHHNHFILIVNFRNHFDKALTKNFQFCRALLHMYPLAINPNKVVWVLNKTYFADIVPRTHTYEVRDLICFSSSFGTGNYVELFSFLLVFLVTQLHNKWYYTPIVWKNVKKIIDRGSLYFFSISLWMHLDKTFFESRFEKNNFSIKNKFKPVFRTAYDFCVNSLKSNFEKTNLTIPWKK